MGSEYLVVTAAAPAAPAADVVEAPLAPSFNQEYDEWSLPSFGQSEPVFS